MSKVWFISDEHFNHANIIKYCNRPFKDATEMNSKLIENWNSLVKHDDLCYHLGDFAFGDKKQIQTMILSMRGRHFLILGNHDRYKPADYMQLGFEWASRFPIIYDQFIILSHEPVFLEENSPFANLYGHLHQNSYVGKSTYYVNCCVEHHDYKPISYDKIKSLLTKS